MRFAPLDRHFTGVSVPVAALRTAGSCGVGDFSDLVPLGRWCREAGLDLIQILPVNDTGANSSPYSALSAFALHPLYLRPEAVPGAGRWHADIDRYRADAAAREKTTGGRFSYRDTLAFKLSFVERLYADQSSSLSADPEFIHWQDSNAWVKRYSVFVALKRRNREAAWKDWPELSTPAGEEIERWWESHPDECMPSAWTQFLLEKQLGEASRSLQDMGVFLKGDLPILMSVESADVWAERRYFDLTATAEAPPDMFSPDGQNWGFPVYDWDRLGKDDYRWWRARLAQAGKFFHAFRIDHVLGFFRIWRIPTGEVTGRLGRFSPSAGLSPGDLRELGFDKARARWLTFPHVSGQELAAGLGAEARRVAERYLSRIGTEDLYNLTPAVDGERGIHGLAEPPEVKSFLLDRDADRTLLDDGSGSLYPSWYLEQKKGFQSLTDAEKVRLREILGTRRAESEDDWERRGRMLLSSLQKGTDMLVCAEDLGDVPRCVPRVLSALGILGLRIVRWSRAYEETPPGRQAAFIPPSLYPPRSVCTPSVHDTSTVRGWWEEDPAERELFFRSLGEKGACPKRLTVALLKKIIDHCCGAASLLCMFPLQDLLDLDRELWSGDPRQDRINVPGTVTEQNWTWRMPLSIGELSARGALTATIREVTARRKARPAGTR